MTHDLGTVPKVIDHWVCVQGHLPSVSFSRPLTTDPMLKVIAHWPHVQGHCSEIFLFYVDVITSVTYRRMREFMMNVTDDQLGESER
jgi:hypothetical protein